MAGTGKATKLREALAAVAAARGLPFTPQMRTLGDGPTGSGVPDGAAEDGAGPEDEAGKFQHEYSLVHMGFDIARMSMQDKHILRPVLEKLGQGSQVMAGDQGRGCRILVLYHAHLLSSESVLLLQACLEQNEGDLSIWMTSEMPVPQRIRDWFVEVAVAGDDHSFDAYKETTKLAAPANWPAIFRALIDKWRGAARPTLRDVKEVKAFIYEMLMRNLRWVEVLHFLLDVILQHPDLTAEERRGAIAALANCEASAGGYTIPSYRIPILWESLFLQLRTVFASQPQADGTASASPARARGSRKRGVAKAGAGVGDVSA